jgi:molybdate transport system substrate-binding protein
MKKRIKIMWGCLVSMSLILAFLAQPAVFSVSSAQTAGCAEEYIAQADDWLSKIAEKLLGDLLAYPAIVEATRQKHADDATFAKIANPDLIEIGWKLCVPGAEEAQALLNRSAPVVRVPLEPANLNIFAAASLTDAFNEIGQNFSTEHSGVSVTFNFAGSQQLAQQLGQGAPADVFASANTKQMEVAVLEAQRVMSGTQQTFVRNRLTVIYPQDNPAGLSGLQDLARPGIKVILAATEVPVGQYSQDFLDKAGQDTTLGPDFKDKVLQNVVSYEENVRAVLTKMVLGEGDAGIVYTSDITGDGAGSMGRIDIPDELNTIATYPIAVVGDTAYPQQAQAFVDYLLSPAGQEVLAKYGFLPISNVTPAE